MLSEQNIQSKVYYRFLLPNMVAILGGTINVLFDGILVGQKLGEVGIASVNQSLAVYLLLCTVGSLIAAGASAESASAIGKNQLEDSQKYFSAALEIALIVGVIVSVIGCLASGPLSELLGSSDSKEMVKIYIWITFAGGLFKILLYIPFFYLRLDGKTKQSAIAMTAMTVINIVLDYVFLFIFDWGIGGAAIANVIATAVACVISFYYLFGTKGSFHFTWIKPSKSMLNCIVKSGSPMASNNLFSALRIICLNAIMNVVGGSDLVAVFAITNSLNEFSISIQNGVPQSASHLLGISYAEKDRTSVKDLVKLQLRSGTVFSLIFAAVITLGGAHIGRLFGCTQDVRIAVFCFGISLILGTINSIMSYYYYAVMDAFMANLITILRVFVLTVLMAWVFRPLKQWIWLFYIAGELTTLIVWIIAAKLRSRNQVREEGIATQFAVKSEDQAICEASEKIQGFCEESGFAADQIMKISLALEELMVVTADKSMNHKGNMEVRIMKTPDGGILRIRCEGRKYNPLEYEEETLDHLGIAMIKKMAKKVEYHSVLGLNTLIVFI